MSNMIKEITDMISPSLLKTAAGALGENESGISKAIGGLAPTLLAGMLGKSNDSSAFGKIFDMISNKSNHVDMNDLGSLLGGGQQQQSSGLVDGLLGSLFGNKTSGIFDLITSFAGLKKGSSSSLMGMIAPMVISYLGKKVLSGGLDALGLSKLLGGQRNNIAGALPAGMGDMLGFAAQAPQQEAPKRAHTPPTPSTGGGNNLFKYLLPILLLGAALFAWRSCGDDVKQAAGDTIGAVEDVAGAAGDMAGDVANAAGDMAKDAAGAVGDAAGAAAGAVGDAVAGLGDFFKRKLANGIELNIPKFGIENKLVDFLEGSGAISKDSWYNFDRLTFATGSSKLDMDKSAEQLNNVAAIMKAYPKMEIKLGGYTDNTGNADNNLKLSQARADAVMAALVDKGVAASRMVAEGYGIAHPVATNDTEEGRAQNRRTAINITAR